MAWTPGDAPTPRWPFASRRRLLLAIYLDYLLFGAPWTIAAAALERFWPSLDRLSFPLNLAFFLVLEFVLMARVRWSPGQYCLGIVASERSAFAPIGPDEKPVYLVDPWLLAHERWWTLLFGVLTILDGAKAIARWTMWHAPVPFMGVLLPFEASVAVMVLFGVAETWVGVAALTLRPIVGPLGLAVFGALAASSVLSWGLMPEWVERYVVARRTHAGMTPRPGEIELMQVVIPSVNLGAALVAAIWAVGLGGRAKRARAL